MGLLSKMEANVQFFDGARLEKASKQQDDNIIVSEEVEVREDDHYGFVSLCSSHSVSGNTWKWVTSCSDLTILTAMTTSEETEMDPVKHCHKVWQMFSRILTHKTAGLMIEGAKHLVSVGFMLVLWGGPLESFAIGSWKGERFFWEWGHTIGTVTPSLVWNHKVAALR